MIWDEALTVYLLRRAGRQLAKQDTTFGAAMSWP